MLLLGKIMILQGVGHPISCLGVCYANDPKKGGYMTPAPALDLTTSLRGDFPNEFSPAKSSPHKNSPSLYGPYLNTQTGTEASGMAGHRFCAKHSEGRGVPKVVGTTTNEFSPMHFQVPYICEEILSNWRGCTNYKHIGDIVQ